MNQISMELPGFEAPPLAAPIEAPVVDYSEFSDDARPKVLTYLRRHGATSGEDLTDVLLAAGVRLPRGDDRNFGSLYAGMSRAKLIEAYGDGNRRKGNGTRGATIWKITAKGLKA